MSNSKKSSKPNEELMAPLTALISKGRRDGVLSSSELLAALEQYVEEFLAVPNKYIP